jgi:hypothetical protein
MLRRKGAAAAYYALLESTAEKEQKGVKFALMAM